MPDPVCRHVCPCQDIANGLFREPDAVIEADLVLFDEGLARFKPIPLDAKMALRNPGVLEDGKEPLHFERGCLSE